MSDDSRNDERLRRLLSDAVAGVEPDDRLDAIRASVRSDPKVVPMTRSHTWTYAAGGILATAAVIGVIAFAAGAVPGFDQADDTAVGAGQPGASDSPSATPSSATPSSAAPSSATTSPSPGSPSSRTYAVYYVGTDPQDRPVLFREFHRGPALPSATPTGTTVTLTQAVRDAIAKSALDPDYVSPWAGLVTLDRTSYDGADTLQITLEDGAPTQRPATMSAAEAKAAIQQLVYTAQAAVGKRVPVTFRVGRHATAAHPTLLGVDVSRPVPAGKVLDTLSLVSISDPNQGETVSGSLKVTGVNNGFEGTVVVYLERGGKHHLVRPTIGGMGGNRMWPWTVTLDLDKVKPGTYTLVAHNDDGSGQGNPSTDTRVIQVR